LRRVGIGLNRRQAASLKRHLGLTIRNLTAWIRPLSSGMRIIKIKRTAKKGTELERSTNRRSVLQFARKFFAGENHWEFAIEALLFAVLLALSAWPIVGAAGAVGQLL
jgi:hypothetical protein